MSNVDEIHLCDKCKQETVKDLRPIPFIMYKDLNTANWVMVKGLEGGDEMSNQITYTVENAEAGRSFTATEEQWEKHGDVIQHWVAGNDVEEQMLDGDWYLINKRNPEFDVRFIYRKAQRKPKTGEVWKCTLTGVDFLIVDADEKVLFDLSKGIAVGFGDPCKLEYIISSIEAYFATKFLKEVDLFASSGSDVSVFNLLKDKADK